MTKVRKFETGAIRDTDNGKLSFAGSFSPLVLERFAQYMFDHKFQPDGSIRYEGNWKKGFPQDVLMESLLRHVNQVWQLHEGNIVHDDKGILVDKESTLCAVMFNTMAYLLNEMKENNLRDTD